jgi:hypothetical protein
MPPSANRAAVPFMPTASIQSGDAVYLAEGPYQGTSGVFRNLVEDPSWGSITETGGRIRSHPMIWLRKGIFPVGVSPLEHAK